MEIGKQYQLTAKLNRRLFALNQEINEQAQNFASKESAALEAGTIVEVVNVDGVRVALLKILSGEYEGRLFASSSRTQPLFTEIR